MFLPENAKTNADIQLAKQRELALGAEIEKKVKARLPAEILGEIEQMHVQEVVCGDPECAPIDTAVMVMFKCGDQEGFGIPCEMQEVLVDPELLETFCPPVDVWRDWSEGKRNNWRPKMMAMDEADYLEQYKEQVKLRFDVGQAVECRVGSDPVTGWAGGKVIELYYREKNWPPNQLAPYKIQLDDGRKIFAPADDNQVIREKNPDVIL